MLQNIQSLSKENVNSVYSNIQWVVIVLQMILWGAQGGIRMKPKGGQSGSSPLRSDGSCDSQAGRLDCMSGGHICSDAQMLKWESENNSRQPRDLLKWAERPPKIESTYSFLGDVDSDFDDHCAVREFCNSKTEYWITFCPDSVFMVSPQFSWWGLGGGTGNRQSTRYLWATKKMARYHSIELS
jgi:hypothetical protein